MNRPAPAYPIAINMSPASRPTTSTALVPYVATIGTRTTVIAPVGPLTCTRLPPNTAATAPATIAVIRPALAPTPELTPTPRASGSATRPTIKPATTSRPGRRCCQSPGRGSSAEVRSHTARAEKVADPGSGRRPGVEGAAVIG